MDITPKRLCLALLLLAGVVAFSTYYRSGPWGQHFGSWQKVDERDFDRRVLQANRPALVYFDTAIGCRGGDVVFTSLSRRQQGVLEVFYVDAEVNPGLARTYGVDHQVLFVLFEEGRVVKRETAPQVLRRVTDQNGGLYADEGFLLEMERFANLR
jgi:hypothetical protein